jgi:t-SNARE complex subunit (syntaxin)
MANYDDNEGKNVDFLSSVKKEVKDSNYSYEKNTDTSSNTSIWIRGMRIVAWIIFVIIILLCFVITAFLRGYGL